LRPQRRRRRAGALLFALVATLVPWAWARICICSPASPAGVVVAAVLSALLSLDRLFQATTKTAAGLDRAVAFRWS